MSESVTCWLYRNTLTLWPENRLSWSDTSCGDGSTPFMMSAWKPNGVRLRVPGGLQHVVADRLGGRHRGARVGAP